MTGGRKLTLAAGIAMIVILAGAVTLDVRRNRAPMEIPQEEPDTLAVEEFKIYNPFRSGRRTSLCPYDSLLRAYADTLGWDWRLLASVAYKESRFRLDVVSRRGAVGLMQVMPETAAAYGVTDLLDPEQNLKAGTKLLKSLHRLYRGIPDREERLKTVLGAYNAGQGRIKACLEQMRADSVEVSRWEDIAEVMTEFRDSGLFDATRAIDYVDDVLALYGQFKRIID